MTGTREWEYIKYLKPIVSLKNFSRFKISMTTNKLSYFKNILLSTHKYSHAYINTFLKYDNTYKTHFYNSLLRCLENNM